MTGMVKVLSAFGDAAWLRLADPVFGIENRLLFLAVGLIELGLGAYGLAGRRMDHKLLLIGWLTSSFVVYRIGLWWLGVRKPCGCLGRVGDWIPWVARYEEGLARAVLVFLIVGVSACLLARLLQRRREVDTGAICSPATR